MSDRPSLFAAILDGLPNPCCASSERERCPYDLKAAADLTLAIQSWFKASIDAAEVDLASAAVEPMRFVGRREALEVEARHKFRAIRSVLVASLTGERA